MPGLVWPPLQCPDGRRRCRSPSRQTVTAVSLVRGPAFTTPLACPAMASGCQGTTSSCRWGPRSSPNNSWSWTCSTRRRPSGSPREPGPGSWSVASATGCWPAVASRPSAGGPCRPGAAASTCTPACGCRRSNEDGSRSSRSDHTAGRSSGSATAATCKPGQPLTDSTGYRHGAGCLCPASCAGSARRPFLGDAVGSSAPTPDGRSAGSSWSPWLPSCEDGAWRARRGQAGSRLVGWGAGNLQTCLSRRSEELSLEPRLRH